MTNGLSIDVLIAVLFPEDTKVPVSLRQEIVREETNYPTVSRAHIFGCLIESINL